MSKRNRKFKTNETQEFGQIAIDTEVKNRLKQQIISVVCQEGDATLVRLEKLEGFSGNLLLCLDEAGNAVIWPRISHEAMVAFQELEAEKRIKTEVLFNARARFIYSYDGFGGFKGIPMASFNGLKKGYKTPHWVPVLVKDGD